MRHTDSIRRIGEVTMRLEGDFYVLEAEVTTAGGIEKMIKLPESEASWLVAEISSRLAERPTEGRAERFKASIRARK